MSADHEIFTERDFAVSVGSSPKMSLVECMKKLSDAERRAFWQGEEWDSLIKYMQCNGVPVSIQEGEPVRSVHPGVEFLLERTLALQTELDELKAPTQAS